MIKAVVIDIDDTLCLTEVAAFNLENDVLVQMGREPMSRDIHISTWGMPLLDAIVKRSPGLDIEQFQKLFRPTIKKYVASGRIDTIPKENYLALDSLINSGKDIMLLTSRRHDELSHLLKSDHSLTPRIKGFYHKDNIKYHKPDPRAFAELLQDNSLRPEQCIYVGDALSDAQAANGAGLHFIASLESGLRQQEDFQDYKVHKFINKFPEITHAVELLEKKS